MSSSHDTVMLSGVEVMELEVQTRLSSWLRALESDQDPAAARLIVRVSKTLHLMDEGLLEESLLRAIRRRVEGTG